MVGGRAIRRTITVVAAAAAVIVAGWFLLEPAASHARTLPDITLERLTGGTVALATAAGQPVVINLWATWCPPCRRELPMMAAAARSTPGVGFYFADQGEDRATVKAYLDERPELPAEHMLLDGSSALSNAFEAMGLPVTLFFDARGNHVLTHVGEVTEVEMLNYLTDLKRGAL